MVAYHSGAIFEARERGLDAALLQFEEPERPNLDLLTFLDMTTGPSGEVTSERDRIDDILRRYGPTDPVNRAVSKGEAHLLAACGRARATLGLPDVGVVPPI
ncbi:hypothetical protein GCM10027194_08140 [Thalassiella azotivora]